MMYALLKAGAGYVLARAGELLCERIRPTVQHDVVLDVLELGKTTLKISIKEPRHPWQPDPEDASGYTTVTTRVPLALARYLDKQAASEGTTVDVATRRALQAQYRQAIQDDHEYALAKL